MQDWTIEQLLESQCHGDRTSAGPSRANDLNLAALVLGDRRDSAHGYSMCEVRVRGGEEEVERVRVS